MRRWVSPLDAPACRLASRCVVCSVLTQCYLATFFQSFSATPSRGATIEGPGANLVLAAAAGSPTADWADKVGGVA